MANIEMPKAEKISERIEKGIEYVMKKLKELGLEDELIFAVPEIKNKLAEMAYNPEVEEKDRLTKTHFEESVKIAELVKTFFEKTFNKMNDKEYEEAKDELGLTQDKERLMLSAILHDIGKTGPDEYSYLNPENVIMELFDYKYGERINTAKTIGEVIREKRGNLTDLDRNQLKKIGLSENNTMREFYDAHSKTSKIILESVFNKEELEDLSEINKQADIISIASQHHYMRNLEYGKKVFGDSLLIEIFDKIIAFSERSHEKSMAGIYESINKLINDMKNEEIKEKFRKILNFILENNVFKEIK